MLYQPTVNVGDGRIDFVFDWLNSKKVDQSQDFGSWLTNKCRKVNSVHRNVRMSIDKGFAVRKKGPLQSLTRLIVS